MTQVVNTQAGTACGGSIVASRYILTSASCLFTDNTFTVPVEASDVTVKHSFLFMKILSYLLEELIYLLG